MQLSPVYRHFLLLGSKYSPLHSVDIAADLYALHVCISSTYLPPASITQCSPAFTLCHISKDV